MPATLPAVFLLMMWFCSASPDLGTATVLYRRGDFAGAVSKLEALKHANPDTAEVHFWLGKSYLKERRWDDAVKSLERAVELSPSSGAYHLWLGRAYGRKAEHSFLFSAFGWARKTLRSFEKAVEVDPRNLDARFDLMEFYLEAPGVVGGGREKADREAREISGFDLCLGYVARAQILQKDKNESAARRELEEAAADCKTRPGVFVDLADLLLSQGDIGGAERAARRALALKSQYPRATLLVARCLIGSGYQLEQAVRSLRTLAAGPLDDEDPTFEEVYFWLGRGLLASGDRSGARQALEKSLRFNPDYEPARSALSRIPR